MKDHFTTTVTGGSYRCGVGGGGSQSGGVFANNAAFGGGIDDSANSPCGLFYDLGRAVLPYQRVATLAMPLLENLRLRCGESVHVGVLDKGLVTRAEPLCQTRVGHFGRSPTHPKQGQSSDFTGMKAAPTATAAIIQSVLRADILCHSPAGSGTTGAPFCTAR
jgi:hypothetical protein